MVELTKSVLLGAAMSGVLYIFYRHVEDEWPAGYRTVSTRYDLFSRRLVLWHVSSRLVVVFIVSALTAHIADAVNARPNLAVAVLVISHVGLTTVRAFWEARSRQHRGSLIAAYNLVLTILLLLVAALGALAAPQLDWAFPSPEALVDSLWIALAVAVALTAIQRLARRIDVDEQDELAAAQRDVGSDALVSLEASASRHDADPLLMRCIVFSESLQRPSWVRRSERWLGRIRHAGTYGVAQIRSDRPLTDAESVDLLAQSVAGSASRIRRADDDLRISFVEGYLELHNRDRVFIDQALQFYEMMGDAPVLGASEDLAADGRAVIELDGVSRSGFQWKVSGTWLSSSDEDVLDFFNDEGDSLVAAPVQTDGSTARLSWNVFVPLEVRSVTARSLSAEFEFDPQELRVDW